jgi:hypothetical protein
MAEPRNEKACDDCILSSGQWHCTMNCSSGWGLPDFLSSEPPWLASNFVAVDHTSWNHLKKKGRAS